MVPSTGLWPDRQFMGNFCHDQSPSSLPSCTCQHTPPCFLATTSVSPLDKSRRLVENMEEGALPGPSTQGRGRRL